MPIDTLQILWYLTTLFGTAFIGILVWGAKRELTRIGNGQEALIQDYNLLREKVNESIHLVHERIDKVEREFYMLKGEHQARTIMGERCLKP